MPSSKEKVKAYADKHRTHLNEWAREYRKRSPEYTRAASIKARRKLKALHPERLMFTEIRKRARARGVPFDLELSDIVIPKVCPILGIELKFGVGRVHDASPSLDRLIPSKGYVKGNCFVISSKANRMKQENTLEDLMTLVRYIQERLPCP